MKNLASRVLALVLVLSVLLLPVSALAAERNAGTLTIGNLELTMDGETISLPLQLQIGGGADPAGERGFGIVKVLTSQAEAFSAMAAIENGEIKAYLNGMSYGLTMPLEQVTALLSDAIESATGATVEDLLAEAGSSISPEMQAAFTKVMDAYTKLLAEAETMNQMTNLDSYWKDVLGAALETAGEAETVTLFDVEVQAVPYTVTMPEITYSQLISKVSTISPAMKEYYDAYSDLLNLMLTESGEKAADFESMLDQISFGMNGTLYQAEEGAYAELTMTMTAEGETLEIPYTITVLTDDAGVYSAVDVAMNVDDEALYVSVYADDFVSDGYDCTNADIMIAVGDIDEEEPETAIMFTVYSVGSEAEGNVYGLDIGVSDGGEVMSMGGSYYALPAVCTEEADSYDGFIEFYVNDGASTIEASLDTNLTLTSVPEGELLTFTKSINPLEADEAALAQLANDAMTALYQGLGVLMQEPAIAAMLGAIQ